MCLALLLVSAILLAYLAGQRERDQLLAAHQSRMAASVKLRAAGMAADIERLRRDVLFLADAAPREVWLIMSIRIKAATYSHRTQPHSRVERSQMQGIASASKNNIK